MNPGGERTEEATPRRRAAALAQGSSPQSHIGQAALTIAAIPLIAWALVASASGWSESLRAAATYAALIAHAPESDKLVAAVCQELVLLKTAIVVVICSIAPSCAAVVAALGCGSLRWSLHAALPRVARISSKMRLSHLWSLENAAQALAAMAATGLVASLALPALTADIIRIAAGADLGAQARLALQASRHLWSASCAVLAVLGALDMAVQRRRYAARLKMTPREVRDERAQTEGRPEAKQRRRAAAAQRSRKLRIGAIKRATAVIVNPTHVAVALRYAPPELEVPAVVAKAAGLLAPVVRAAGSAYGVPVIEAPELARQLFERCDVDQPIPEECYAAVAAVFSWILNAHGVLRRGDEEKQ